MLTHSLTLFPEIETSLMPAISPSITIMMALYNGASTLQRCLDSVKDQTYPHRELIIIDGGSTDGSIEILGRNNQEIDFWVSEPDNGIYHAWNKGLEKSTGDWINFLGADDYFMNGDVLAKVAERIGTCDPATRLVYGREAIVSSTGTVMEINGEPWDELRKKFLKDLSLPHTAFFHHRTLFESHGRFDESFRIAGDSEFLLRELKAGKAEFFPDIIIKAVTCSGISKNWDRNASGVMEIARAKAMHGIYPYDRSWLLLFAKSTIKRHLASLVGSRGTQCLVDWYRCLTGRRPIWRKM